MIIPLFVYPHNLEYETLNWQADGDSLAEAKFTDRNGVDWIIYQSRENGEMNWVICGGMTFLEFDNKQKFNRTLIEIQGKNYE